MFLIRNSLFRIAFHVCTVVRSEEESALPAVAQVAKNKKKVLKIQCKKKAGM